MSAVKVKDLVVRHGALPLVGPVSFEVGEGEQLGMQGPSGAGKSTLLRALVGLLPAGLSASGAVEVLGEDVGMGDGRVDFPALRSRATLVSQVPVVFPTSILANAALAVRHVMRGPRGSIRERAVAALEEAGLLDEVRDRLDAPAAQLSVGQRQRLCLARALALDPDLLLLDEPTSALDAAATATVEKAIAGLSRRRSVLIVSHDADQLERLCGAVVTLRP